MKTNIVVERFDSLTDFVNVIGSREVNSAFTGHSLHSELGSRTFTLTDSYNDSLTLLMNGYKDGLDNLTSSTDRKLSISRRASRNTPTTGVVGYAPHVPNAITGVPQSMITSTPVEQKAKVVTILYNISDGYDVDGQRFIDAGRNLLTVIMMLELHGYRVGLKVLLSFLAKSREQVSFCVVQIKHHRQPINPLKIAYPLLHPSYFRRQGFKWLETCPEVTDNGYYKNYGIVLRGLPDCSGINERRSYLRKNNVMEDGCFYTEFEEAEAHTPEKLIEVMGIAKANFK